MEFVALKQAKDLGLTRYFTGVPCCHGHVAERLTSSRVCVVCTQDKIAKYRAKNREALLAKKRKAQNDYRRKYPDKVKATAKSSTYKHRIARNEEKAVWAKKNRGRVLAWCRKRQLDKIQRTPAWLVPDDLWLIEQFYETAVARTKATGIQWHVDHKIPLRGKTVSGLHVPYNLQVILGSENSRKGNRVQHA
jgi:5-methylcytosine-specific restriction endonuclease McrA